MTEEERRKGIIEIQNRMLERQKNNNYEVPRDKDGNIVIESYITAEQALGKTYREEQEKKRKNTARK